LEFSSRNKRIDFIGTMGRKIQRNKNTPDESVIIQYKPKNPNKKSIVFFKKTELIQDI